MAVLQLVAETSSENSGVYFRINSEPCQFLPLIIPPALSELRELPVIAELFAINHLLGVKHILNHKPHSSFIGTKILVSRGGVKKLHKGRKVETKAYQWALFLQTRCREAEVEVSKDRSWQNLSINKIWDPVALLPIDAAVEVKGIGRFTITRHALDRYIERFPCGELITPWKNLYSHLNKDPLELVDVKWHAKLSRFFRHQKGCEIWTNPLDGMHYVFVVDKFGKKLVTTFHK